jgi:hypothetical protein
MLVEMRFCTDLYILNLDEFLFFLQPTIDPKVTMIICCLYMEDNEKPGPPMGMMRAGWIPWMSLEILFNYGGQSH